MKKLIGIIAFILTSITILQAQRGPLRGSGRIVEESFDFKDFDKIKFEDLDGKIEVKIGTTFAIKVAIDDNLQTLLRVEKETKGSILSVGLRGNTNNKMYIEDTHIKVYISLPEASVIVHRGNSSLEIHSVSGRYLRLENYGNGDVTAQGDIDMLDIKKNGNGDVNVQHIIAKIAKINSYGNGDVKVNAQISLTAQGSGNGNVVQFGPGKIDPMSGIMGNGEVKRM